MIKQIAVFEDHITAYLAEGGYMEIYPVGTMQEAPVFDENGRNKIENGAKVFESRRMPEKHNRQMVLEADYKDFRSLITKMEETIAAKGGK